MGLFSFVWLVCAWLVAVEAKVITGPIGDQYRGGTRNRQRFKRGSSSTEDWEFVGKFCFNELGGYIVLDIDLGINDNPYQMIHFYADVSNQWPTIYNQELGTQTNYDCGYKTRRASLSLALAAYNNTRSVLKVTGDRSRWWYVVLSNCKQLNLAPYSSGLNVKNLTISFINGLWRTTANTALDEGAMDGISIFVKHFGQDEQGVLETSLALVVFYWCFHVVCICSKMKAKQNGMQYSTIKVFGIAALLTSIGLLLQTIHYLAYAYDGLGYPWLESANYFLAVGGELITITLLLYLSQGWTISTNFIPGRRLMFLAVVATFVVNVILFSYGVHVDPASTVYIYESIPGVLVCAIRVALGTLTLYYLKFTITHEADPKRVRFYKVFGVFVTINAISLPVTTIIALEVPTWDRRKIIFGLQNGMQLLLYILLWYLFRPFKGNRFVKVLSPKEDRPFASNTQIFPDFQPLTNGAANTTERGFDDLQAIPELVQPMVSSNSDI